VIITLQQNENTNQIQQSQKGITNEQEHETQDHKINHDATITNDDRNTLTTTLEKHIIILDIYIVATWNTYLTHAKNASKTKKSKP